MHKFNRARLTAGAVSAVASLMLLAQGASAQVVVDPLAPDTTGGAYDDALSAALSWATNYGLPGLFVLAAFGLVVAVSMRFFKKAKSAVG